MSQTVIAIDQITKRFAGAPAVNRVSLEVREGEFFALLGPSGCGKTTLLRLIAGFEQPDEGRVLIDGRDMSGAGPNKRPVNMVFQSYALFPHMSVADNVGYGLKIDAVPLEERAARVRECLTLVRLEDFAARAPDQLSGGQRQRVALARALAKRPRVLLLDEPLSALDAKLRAEMRFELAQLQRRTQLTFLMVTHDQDEALALADRCAVMNDGRLEQVDTPSDLYERPASRFVADFIGAVNLFEGAVEREREGLVLKTGGVSVLLPDGAAQPGEAVCAAVRPERITMVSRRDQNAPSAYAAPRAHNVVAGSVRHGAYQGAQTLFEVTLDGGGPLVKVRCGPLTAREAADFATGEPVWLSWDRDAARVLRS